MCVVFTGNAQTCLNSNIVVFFAAFARIPGCACLLSPLPLSFATARRFLSSLATNVTIFAQLRLVSSRFCLSGYVGLALVDGLG